MALWRHSHAISFHAARAQFKLGTYTPRDFLEECLTRIGERESELHAFVVLNVAAARKAADESTLRYRRGESLSPLDGCPIGVKDIIATADMPTQMNSPAFAGWQSGYDAACVYALRRAGAIIVGKTVTTEFAIGGSGPTTNPFDRARTPGGSSSGTAAAIGAGMLPAGLGTQTGGSTLRPASYCGVVGFKPTIGALHMGGVHPLSTTCDHLGVIAASLDDAWLTASQISLGAISPGHGLLNGASLEMPQPIRPRCLIWLHTKGWREIDGETDHEFRGLMDVLRERGVEIIDRESDARVAAFEDEIDREVDGAQDIVACEMQWPFADYIARHGAMIGPRIHGLLARADELGPAGYERTLAVRQHVQQQWAELAKAVVADAYVTLASSGPAPLGLEHTGSRTFLTYASWLGVPAFSLPLIQVAGLPVGLQLIGAAGEDGALCARVSWIMKELAGA
jgi:Asp-tRNA(Asn)/Glu-tRNA(Gln) amidotransferase A subunit family amidase